MLGSAMNAEDTGRGVVVASIQEDNSKPIKKYDPNHPDAVDGYVYYPNINPVTEMVDMISASRAYEANIQALAYTPEKKRPPGNREHDLVLSRSRCRHPDLSAGPDDLTVELPVADVGIERLPCLVRHRRPELGVGRRSGASGWPSSVRSGSRPADDRESRNS